MPKRFTERILEFLSRPDYRPMKTRKLAVAMGVAEAEFGDFHDAVDALRRMGRVVLGTSNAVSLPPVPRQVIGTFRANPRGFGFVSPEGTATHGDLFVAPGDSMDAVTGDKVLCEVTPRGRRDGERLLGGRVTKIIERGHSRFVGLLRQEGGVWFVQPDGNMLHVPILVGDVGAKQARAGDQVVVEITRFPSEGRPAKGVIVERLGRVGEMGVDLKGVIRQFNLPEEFPARALAEARAAARSFESKWEKELAGREDLRDLVTVTIDPDDARDFDDAISLERLSTADRDAGGRRARSPSRAGGAVWELGVHIADVSHFVREGSALDAEARLRGTSVYFPGYVIPMLPEVLSNGVCSLQEGEPRFCKSVFIRYGADGEVLGTRFANSVICSTRRLTYGRATAIIEGKGGAAGGAGAVPIPRQAVDLVRRMETLARIIERRRYRDGMISLDLPEVKLILDEKGRLIDAEPEDTSYSHTVIEMFMVEANEAVARLLERLDVPFIRRIHPDPDEQAMEAMASYLRAAGFTAPRSLSPGDLQSLLASIKGRPEAYAVNLAVLKSMEMAEYSPRAVGHFALASRCYAHFTSPIRRYADLTVHRLLDRYLREPDRSGRALRAEAPAVEELAELARRLSSLSRRAENAEEELKTVKVLQLLERQVGETFEGVVTGVTNFGLFVQHPKYLIDGLLRIEDLGDDWWNVDLPAGRIVGERTRETVAMGTLLAVQIAEVDVSARRLNLVPVGRRSAGRGRAQDVGRGAPGRTRPGRRGDHAPAARSEQRRRFGRPRGRRR